MGVQVPPLPPILKGVIMAVVGTCKVCGGNIIEDIQTVKINSWDPPIYGPGSKDQYSQRVVGYYCESCKIKYRGPLE